LFSRFRGVREFSEIGEFRGAARILADAVRARAFPAAVAEVGDASRPLWSQAFGTLAFEAGSPPATLETVFDLASLTKVLATTPILMQEVERGALGLDDPVSKFVPAWRSPDRSEVTIRDLLAHCSGLPAHLHFYRTMNGRGAIEQAICDTPLEYAPRTQSVYSDLGFMLLGFILEERLPFPQRFDALRAQMAIVEDLQFHPPAIWRTRMAPIEQPFLRDVRVGEVADENAAALGGAAGHAGLFGTAAAVGQHARHLLQVLEGKVGAFQRATLEEFVTRRESIPGSSRALGWDTMLPTSSCGHRMSSRAFGHPGFTGTSLWIDPQLGVYIVLLTNRVHPSDPNDAIRSVRPAFHDAVMEGL
jgi:CubicO group peptidase (beta-lactamase class C family)